MTKKTATSKMDYICGLLQASAKGKNTPKTAYEAASLAKDILTTLVNKYEKLDTVFEELGMVGKKNVWGECPECGSPIIKGMENCDFCNTTLTDGVVEEAIAVEEEEETPVKKKAAKKKASKKAAKKVVEDEPEEEEEIEEDESLDDALEDFEEEADDEEYEDEEEVEEEGEEEEEAELPDPAVVLKMKKPQLQEIIDEFELEVDLDEHKGIKNQRLAVNEALDELEGEYEEEEDEEVESEADVLDDMDEDDNDVELEEDEEEMEEDEEEDDLEDDDEDIDLDGASLEELEELENELDDEDFED